MTAIGRGLVFGGFVATSLCASTDEAFGERESEGIFVSQSKAEIGTVVWFHIFLPGPIDAQNPGSWALYTGEDGRALEDGSLGELRENIIRHLYSRPGKFSVRLIIRDGNEEVVSFFSTKVEIVREGISDLEKILAGGVFSLVCAALGVFGAEKYGRYVRGRIEVERAERRLKAYLTKLETDLRINPDKPLDRLPEWMDVGSERFEGGLADKSLRSAVIEIRKFRDSLAIRETHDDVEEVFNRFRDRIGWS